MNTRSIFMANTMKNLSYDANLSAYTIEDLTMAKDSFYAEAEVLYKTTTKAISNLLDQYLNNWEVDYMFRDRLELGIKDSSRHLSVTIYFGEKLYSKDNKFEFNISPSCIGSFNIINDSEERTYFEGIGKIISNEDINRPLLKILEDFFYPAQTIDKDIYIIEHEIDKRNNEAKKITERNEMLEEFKTTKAAIIEAKNKLKDPNNLNADMWVIIRKDCPEHLANATCRKKNVQVMPYGVMTGSTTRGVMYDCADKNDGSYAVKHVRTIKLNND